MTIGWNKTLWYSSEEGKPPRKKAWQGVPSGGLVFRPQWKRGGYVPWMAGESADAPAMALQSLGQQEATPGPKWRAGTSAEGGT